MFKSLSCGGYLLTKIEIFWWFVRISIITCTLEQTLLLMVATTTHSILLLMTCHDLFIVAWLNVAHFVPVIQMDLQLRCTASLLGQTVKTRQKSNYLQAIEMLKIAEKN